MPDWQALITSVVALGVLVLLLRWAYGGKRRSLVARRPRVGSVEEYGLLTPVAAPENFVEGELARRTLEDAGIRATLVTTADGPRLMVFPDELSVARALLRGP